MEVKRHLNFLTSSQSISFRGVQVYFGNPIPPIVFDSPTSNPVRAAGQPFGRTEHVVHILVPVVSVSSDLSLESQDISDLASSARIESGFVFPKVLNSAINVHLLSFGNCLGIAFGL